MTAKKPEQEEKLTPLKQAQARVGTDLSPKWRIDRVLGVGGMGTVFGATHKNNGTRAAVKVLHVEYARTMDVRDRFLREGRIANRVDHPARVAVVDDGLSDLGEPFLVMEMLEGMTLAELFRRGGGRMPLDKLFGIFDTVLDLLGKCHEVGIVHRDIKPANIFLTKQGPVRVLDFGVARMREPNAGVEATRAGIALGTASFIAPEQALGVDKVDGRADLFSVGACIYTGLTGERLHAAKTEAEEFVLAATQAAPPVARKAKEAPAEVAAFVDRALGYDRAQRFQSAQEMRAELLRLLVGVRSGQIKAGKQQATGVVVRGKDAIDEGPAWSNDKEKKDATLRLASIFKQINLAMASMRQYGMSHPQTKRALDQAYAEIGTGLADNPYSLRWDVTTDGFIFEGTPIWLPDRVPFDRIPHQLFADGIRKTQFKIGLSEEELRDFIVILMREVSNLFTEEDDSVTALWDRRFEHIAYLAVDSFAEGETVSGKEDAAEWNSLAERAIQFARIDKDFETYTLEGQAAEINIASALREAGEAAAALALDPITRASLGAQTQQSTDKWLEAFLDAFVPAYYDARERGDVTVVHTAFSEWTADQIKLHSSDRVFEVFEALGEALRRHGPRRPNENVDVVEVEIASVLFPVDSLRAILGDIAAEKLTQDGSTTTTVSAKVAKGLERALDLVASDAVFGLALDCLDSSRSPSLRDVLVPYVRRWCGGHEQLLGSMLARSGGELGKIIVALLSDMKTIEAQKSLERAFDNPTIEVRLAALAYVGEGLGDKARDEIMSLLAAPDVDIRLRTLDLITQLAVVAAGPVLVWRIQSDAFHDLSLEERRRWLTTVMSLKSNRGEALAIELLAKRKLLGSDALDESRALAAEVLAECDSTDAVIALEAASKQRWGTSNSVRDAATKALANIQARRSTAQRPDAVSEGKV